MAAQMTTQTGWWVRFPFLLREEPKEKNDLVVEIHFEADFEIDDLYSSEVEAWKVARKYLTEQRDQALKELEFLSKPYTSPSGITYICPQEKIEAWKEEARTSLRIAGKGLGFCPS